MTRAPIRGILAIDQAEHSGWAITALDQHGHSTRVVSIGLATSADHRRKVINHAAEVAGGFDQLAVIFEDHSDFYFGRGNASVATLLGLGAYKGRWEEHLDAHSHPKAKRFKVTPKVWRRAVLGLVGNAAKDRAKQAAQLYARVFFAELGNHAVGFAPGPDESEALCMLRYAEVTLLPGLSAPKAAAPAARPPRAKRPELPPPSFTVTCRHCGFVRNSHEPAECCANEVA